jgi:hypothetical protein
MQNQEFNRIPIQARGRQYAAVDIFHPHTEQKHMLGRIMDLDDGRRFRYCLNGTVALAKAIMAQGPTPVANWTEIAQSSGTAFVVGDTTVQIGVTTTAPTANQWVDGWLLIQDVTAAALGDLYQIASHSLTATPTVDIADVGGVRTATTTSTELSVIQNPHRETLVVPAAAATNVVVGVTQVIVPASTAAAPVYYWAQTRGPAAILVDTDTLVVGNPVGETATANIAGACGVVANDGTGPVWGTVMQKPTNTQTDQPALVYLTLE